MAKKVFRAGTGTAASHGASGAGDEATIEQLLDWYRRSSRRLPWRAEQEPYRILVSEVMLQQTRAATVVPYYGRFLAAFPDVESLAEATPESVLSVWSGLGYYGRARRLHAAAREIVRRGGVPRTARELQELPGVGPYTAAAVASIAFGEVVPAVDGNVERVAARLLALARDPRRAPGRARVRAIAGRLLDHRRPGDSNQALMELGATVCTVRAPRCDRCPLASHCRARASGRPEDFPVRGRGRRQRHERRVVVVARREGRFLLARNPDEEPVLAGLWEFPWVRHVGGRCDWEAALGRAFGGSWRVDRVLGRVRHAITFRSLRLEIRAAHIETASDELAKGPPREVAWLTPREIAERPTTSMVRKVLSCALQASLPRGPARARRG